MREREGSASGLCFVDCNWPQVPPFHTWWASSCDCRKRKGSWGLAKQHRLVCQPYRSSHQKQHFWVGMLEAQAETTHWPLFGGWGGPEEGLVIRGHWAILNIDSHTKKVLLGHSSKKSIGLGAKSKSCSSGRLWEPHGDGLVWEPYPTFLLVWLRKELWVGKEGEGGRVQMSYPVPLRPLVTLQENTRSHRDSWKFW